MGELTRESVESGLRAIVGIAGYNMQQAIRQYALIKQNWRSENGLGGGALEDFVEPFSTGTSFADDAEKIRRIVQVSLDAFIADITPAITAHEMADPRDKNIHKYRLYTKFSEWQKNNGITNVHLKTPDELKAYQEADMEEYYIPIAIAMKDAQLREALQRKIRGDSLDDSQQMILAEKKDIVALYEQVLFSTGYEMLAHPATTLNALTLDGTAAFSKAFYAGRTVGHEKLTTAQTQDCYKEAAAHFRQSSVALSHILQEMDGIICGSVSLDKEFIAGTRKAIGDIENAVARWQNNYDTKLKPTLLTAYEVLKKFTGDNQAFAESLWYTTPLPLGADKLFPENIASLKTATDVLEKEMPIFRLDSEIFLKFYSALTELKERMLMPLHRAEIIRELFASLKNGTSQIGPNPPKTLIRFAETLDNVAQTVAYGYGNVNAPTSPKSMRGILQKIIDDTTGELSQGEIAMFTLLRCQKPLPVLETYALQQVAALDVVIASENLPQLHRKASSMENSGNKR